MKITDIFRPLKKKLISRYKELGTYQSTFSIFGDDIYNSGIVRSCIRPLAEFSAKAEAYCGDSKIANILNNRPNMYMSGYDFLLKVRTKLELLNVAFIYIQRDDKAKVIGYYPVPYTYFEAVEYANGLFIQFFFNSPETPELILPWEDLAVLRKDYNKSDISGDDNTAIVAALETMNTIDQGLANSIKATANLRGLLKIKLSMLAADDIKAQQERFVTDYLNLENHGGIAAIDNSQEFIPITMNPYTASAEHRKEVREDIYRYFGMNDDILTANVKTEILENFYKLRIEGFLIQLSQELTSKSFGGKALAYEKNTITYMTDRGQFMTINQKLDLFNKVVLYGGMTVNEWRHLLGYPDIEGGDTPIRRLDADFINTDENPRQGNESEASKQDKNNADDEGEEE